MSVATKPVKELGNKIKDYVPDISETELAKKMSKTVDEVETKIADKTNIYQYGGFRSKADRDKIRKTLEQNDELNKQESNNSFTSEIENNKE